MTIPHHDGEHHGHDHYAEADTHGQAMPHGHPHSALDEQHPGHNGHKHAGHDHDHHDDHHVHGHGEHAGHSVAMFKNRFWWSLILSVPVVFFSPMFAEIIGYQIPDFPGSTWIAPILGTVIFLYGGLPFLKGGWTELRSRQPGMMLLIAMAITVAFVASWITTLGIGGFHLDFWWELALLVTIMLLGHWMEMRALGSASSALDALTALLPASVARSAATHLPNDWEPTPSSRATSAIVRPVSMTSRAASCLYSGLKVLRGRLPGVFSVMVTSSRAGRVPLNRVSTQRG